MKYPYSIKLCQFMSKNGGQTMDLSCFPHTFMICGTPGHLTKKAFKREKNNANHSPKYESENANKVKNEAKLNVD